MCGRARSSRPAHALAQAFGVPPSRVYGAGQYQPRHNLHPGNATPVLVREDGRSHAYHRQQQPHTAAPSSSAASRPAFPPSATARAQAHADALEREKEAHEAAASVAPSPPPKAGERSLVCMKWGLVPSWHKKGEKPDYFRAFNARSETVASKPFFKRLVNSRRCVVVLDGFYEWVVDGKGQKQPYYVHWEDDRPMTARGLPFLAQESFAGLYDCWESAEGERVYTYTILTREPSSDWAWLHNRFPLILPDHEAEAQWLDSERHKIEDILLPTLRQPLDLPGVVCHPCAKRVNNMAYEQPDAADPIKLEPPGKAAAAAAGMPTLHRFFSPASSSSSSSSPGPNNTKKGKAPASPSPYQSPPHVKTGKKAEGEEEEVSDGDVVVVTPSEEEASGGGDARKHAAAVVGGKKKREAVGAESPGKRRKQEEKGAIKAFFPKSK